MKLGLLNPLQATGLIKSVDTHILTCMDTHRCIYIHMRTHTHTHQSHRPIHSPYANMCTLICKMLYEMITYQRAYIFSIYPYYMYVTWHGSFHFIPTTVTTLVLVRVL